MKDKYYNEIKNNLIDDERYSKVKDYSKEKHRVEIYYKNIKTIEENNTVGIIICKQDNEYVIKYCSDNRIIAREYELV